MPFLLPLDDSDYEPPDVFSGPDRADEDLPPGDYHLNVRFEHPDRPARRLLYDLLGYLPVFLLCYACAELLGCIGPWLLSIPLARWFFLFLFQLVVLFGLLAAAASFLREQVAPEDYPPARSSSAVPRLVPRPLRVAFIAPAAVLLFLALMTSRSPWAAYFFLLPGLFVVCAAAIDAVATQHVRWLAVKPGYDTETTRRWWARWGGRFTGVPQFETRRMSTKRRIALGRAIASIEDYPARIFAAFLPCCIPPVLYAVARVFLPSMDDPPQPLRYNSSTLYCLYIAALFLIAFFSTPAPRFCLGDFWHAMYGFFHYRSVSDLGPAMFWPPIPERAKRRQILIRAVGYHIAAANALVFCHSLIVG